MERTIRKVERREGVRHIIGRANRQIGSSSKIGWSKERNKRYVDKYLLIQSKGYKTDNAPVTFAYRVIHVLL